MIVRVIVELNKQGVLMMMLADISTTQTEVKFRPKETL